MKDWRDILLTPETKIRDTIQAIDSGALGIALVTDSNGRLIGTVTDGDIRRGILKGVSLESPVAEIMNGSPTVARSGDSREKILAIMKMKTLHQIPVVDEKHHVIGLEVLESIIQTPHRENLVVLMAGGLGTRLRPLTDTYPKPLIKIGGKPVLETILENFISHGFYRFRISVNYKAELIEEYFGDGSRWGCTIDYIHENMRMGTAGALTLLDEEPHEPLLVMNGDVLTNVNFQKLLDYHKERHAHATMCIREYDYQVPYGVVRFEQHHLLGIEEKPVQRYFVNAGIYVLQPEVLSLIPRNAFFDMPQLFESLISEDCRSAIFPIREYWLDIGRMDDLERANIEFKDNFVYQ